VAEQGDSSGYYNLGVFYFYGKGGLKKDKSQAAYWMEKAYDNGHYKAKNFWNKHNLAQYKKKALLRGLFYNNSIFYEKTNLI
jgi:TPR repeat protein